MVKNNSFNGRASWSDNKKYEKNMKNILKNKLLDKYKKNYTPFSILIRFVDWIILILGIIFIFMGFYSLSWIFIISSMIIYLLNLFLIKK